MHQSNTIRASLVVASVLGFGLTVGCGAPGSGGGGSGDPPDPPLVIADDPVPDAEGRILLPPGHEGIRPGSGLITGNGTHLYKIEDIEVMPDGSLRISTSQGSLAQLGVAGEFRFVDPPDGTPAEKRGPRLFGPDVNLQILDVSMPFSATVNLTDSGSVTATVEGVFELEGEFHLAFDVGLFSGLRTFSTYIAGDVFLDLDASVEARIAATFAREETEEAVTERFRTYYHGVIGAPPYYIVVEVTSQLFIGFEGNVEGDASLETGVYASAAAKVGANYDSSRTGSSRWSTVAEAGFDWGYDEPVVCFDGSGSLRAYLRPHFEVQLYTVVGPTFDIEPYGRLDASIQGCLGDAAAAYDVTLTAGAVGYAKIKADILDILVLESPRMTVFDVSRELGRWQNTPLDSDGDGVPDSIDECKFDPNKTSPGVCGCGDSDVDSDGDGTADCTDDCPNDRNKTSPGTCDCGNPEVVGCGTYELTTSTVGAGSVSPSSGTYEAGTVVELIASPSAGWYFDHWEGDLSGSSPTRTVTMTVHREVVAVFEQTPPPPSDCDPACEEGFECDDGECIPDGPPVVICHIPPGNPGNAHTVIVNESAVPAHLAHGDTLGPCCMTDADCDDGLFCNGMETCDFGTDGIATCMDGTPPCDPETETCDEATHTCPPVQTVWIEQSVSGPPQRARHAMAYDSCRDVTVLFGGFGGSTGSYLGDTWEWDGSAWTLVCDPSDSCNPAPSAREAHAMAFDEVRCVTVLFGGVDLNGNYLNDTWEWDGTTWTQRCAGCPPPTRQPGGMAYDSAEGVVLLFGGWNASNYLNDLWAWDSATWEPVSTDLPRPSPRSDVAMAYDVARDRTVVFGGSTQSGECSANSDETWELDMGKSPATWTLVCDPGGSCGPAPSPRSGPRMMAYRAAADVMVLFGGSDTCATMFDDTWEWNGSTWTQVVTEGPSSRWYHAMAYDAAREEVLLFGGYLSYPGSITVGDTWVYRVPE